MIERRNASIEVSSDMLPPRNAHRLHCCRKRDNMLLHNMTVSTRRSQDLDVMA